MKSKGVKIAILSGKGGTGKTLVSVNLASIAGVSRILCKLKNAVQIEQIYSKGAARKSAVPFAVILVNTAAWN